jgi:hypothetical protein
MNERKETGSLPEPRTLFVCQKCGEEVGEGEQDHRGRHPSCGGTLDPVGECDDDA